MSFRLRRTPQTVFLVLSVALIIGVLGAAWAGADVSLQARNVFGPESFARTSGATNVYTRSFTVPSYVIGPYILHIENGQASGTGRLTDAISSGTVSINGVEIVHKSDFNQNVPSIDRTVTLTTTNALTVTLNSAPDSLITVTISGVINLGRLNQSRSGHTATVQADGEALITGGRDNAGELNTAERFDPRTLTFIPISGVFGDARSGHAGSVLADAMHLLMAGQNGGSVLTGTELFDPATGLFVDVSGSVRLPRSGHTATALLDGRVLIIGGRSTGVMESAELFDAQSVILFKPSYDPRSGSFAVLPKGLFMPRWDHTATMLPDGRVLIAGGRNDFGVLGSAELFDPALEQFTPLTSAMTAARGGHTATLMPDGRVLVLGGQNDAEYPATAELFDPSTGRFLAAASGLLAPRANHAATLLPFGEVLIVGGENGGGILDAAELYGPPPVDIAPPAVVEITPPDGATNVDLTQIIGVRFSEPVDVRTLNASSVTLSGSASGGGMVDSIISPTEQGLMVFIVPKAGADGRSPLRPGTTYTVTLTSDIQDTAGNPLVPFTSRFTTVAAPVITNVAPNYGPDGTNITIAGQHFDPTAPTLNVVKFNGVESPVTSATSTQLETSVPSDAPVGAGTLSVTTRGGAASASFTVENPIPSLTSISPGSVVAGSGAVTVTLNGGNFIPSSSVNFGSTVLTPVFIGNTQLQVNIPAAAVATAVVVPITVINPAPGGGSSNSLPFTVIPTFTLSVNRTGDGTGSVSSSSNGINCGADCQEIYPSGTVITLTASPDADSFNAGFSGGCISTTTTCTLTITQNTSVTAAFNLLRLTSITVTPNNPTITLGQTQSFSAMGTFNNGSARALTSSEVTWSSSGTTVATVDTAGLATGQSAGTTTIKATAGSVSGGDTTTSQLILLSAGGVHTCAMFAGGTVKCWGGNFYGQLGNGTTTNSLVPVAVSEIATAVEVSAGPYHTCAVLSDGTLKCWGYNTYGQLGNRTMTNSSIPVAVSGITTAVGVAAGLYTTCAVLSDGIVKCWGYNDGGQLGNGTLNFSLVPVTVTGITSATAVSVGSSHTCAVLSDGTVKCWGYNGNGQLGNGTTAGSTTPVAVTGITSAAAVEVGFFHACARLTDGSVKCWGSGGLGRLGNGTITNSSIPVAVSGISTATTLSAGSSHACARLSEGIVKCWGDNTYGQLGNGSLAGSSNLPVAASGISTAMAITAGSFHTCAVLSDGAVKCSGYNALGQLGNGTTTNSSTPVTVAGFSPVGGISGSTALTVNNPVPTLTSLSPASAMSGTGSFTLTLNGIGFVPTAIVYFNGISLTPTYINSTELRVNIPASAILTAGNRPVSVTNPVPGGGVSNIVGFTVIPNPIRISIDSPTNGSFITPLSVLVEGTVGSDNSEVGVMVNGVVALVNGDRFAANDVPLVLGINTITATATDIAGNTRSVSVAVTSGGVENPVRLLANPESGVAPLEVKFSVLTSLTATITGVTLDADGDGVVDLTSAALPESVSYTYNQPGLYYATVRITDNMGNVYMNTVTINVLDKVQLDALLQAKWTGMRDALRQGDIEKTLTYFTYGSQDKYRRIFEAIGANLIEEAQNLPDITLVTFYGTTGKYRVQRTVTINGQSQTLTYWVYFIQDTDGIFRIKQF